jgi:hypothetical protein
MDDLVQALAEDTWAFVMYSGRDSIVIRRISLKLEAILRMTSLASGAISLSFRKDPSTYIRSHRISSSDKSLAQAAAN